MNLNGSIEVALVYTTRDFWETVNWDLKGALSSFELNKHNLISQWRAILVVAKKRLKIPLINA